MAKAWNTTAVKPLPKNISIEKEIKPSDPYCLNCNDKTFSKRARFHLACCSKYIKIIGGRTECREKCPRPPTKMWNLLEASWIGSSYFMF